jgi:outer membrane protein
MKHSMAVPIVVLALLICPSFPAGAQTGRPASQEGTAPTTAGEVGSAEVVTLAQGLERVISIGHDVQITREGENIAAADVSLARSGFLPSINGSTAHTSLAYPIIGVTTAQVPIINTTLAPPLIPGLVVGQTTQKVFVPENPTNFWTYSASIQETLFDFWRTLSLFKAEKELLANSKLDTARVRNLSALQFTRAYFDLLEAERLVAVAQAEVERLDSHLKDAQNLYSSGVITKNDLLQAEVRLKDGIQRLLSARNFRALRASTLNNVLVWPLDKPVRVVDIAFEPEAPPFTLDEAWDRALKDRPEIRIVDGSLKALRLEETARKADYYPTFFVKGGVDYSQNQYLLHDTNWSAIVGMSVNIFSGGATQAEVARLRSQQDQVLKQRAKLADDIKLEVQAYVLDLNSAMERIRVNRGAAEQAQENLRINKVRYDAGEGIATEVLDAVTLLTTAETNYINAIYDFRRSEAGMYYAIGKDLREVYRQ